MQALRPLSRISHICFDVVNIEGVIPLYSRLLGVQCAGINTLQLEGGAGVVKTAFFHLQGCSIELAEHHLPASWENTPLATRPGFHHIAFETSSFDETLKQLAEQGIIPLPGFPMRTPHGRVAFLDPEQTDGILYEVAEREGTR